MMILYQRLQSYQIPYVFQPLKRKLNARMAMTLLSLPKQMLKRRKSPLRLEVLSKPPEYPHLKEKAKPINLKPISGLKQLNDDLMQLKQVRPVQMNATITPPPVSKDSSNPGNPTTESKWSISCWANLVKLIQTTILRQFLTKICRFN